MDVTNQPGHPSQRSALRCPTPSPRIAEENQGNDLIDGLEDTHLWDEALIENQDEAQAALQPAISAAASHLTSSHTPAAEKAAALERIPGHGYFNGAIAEGGDEDFEADTGVFIGNSSAERHSPPFRNSILASQDAPRSNQTRGVLGSAFGPTRKHRSTSAGQEAFRRLQKALPSLSGHTSFLPSLPSSFFSHLMGDGKGEHSIASKSTSGRPRSMTLTQPPTGSNSGISAGYPSESKQKHSFAPFSLATPTTGTSTVSSARPPVLRRVTSDESMLYHSLSRQSSLGDDNRFTDVREMVNIRFMAIKDSLPDVPNFKMPSLARLQAASRRSSISINGLFSGSSDDALQSRTNAGLSRDVPIVTSAPTDTSSAMDRALEELTGDIVVLGGYRGSILRSAEPPNQQLWAPVKLGFRMRKANLEVGLEDEDETTMEERIIPSGMLKHIGPVDISRKLFKKLRSAPNVQRGTLRVWDFGYDWRLSPALSSRKLQDFLSNLPSNQPGTMPESRGAIVIAHSLGGLITRHAVNNQPHLFAGVLYAGVPQRCINILGPMRNGDVVLFNEKLLTAQVNLSIRTSFALLPDDGFCFVDKVTGEEYPVDFFDADSWAKWRLSPCVGDILPPYNRDKQQTLSLPLSALFTNSLLRNKKTMDAPEAANAVNTIPHYHGAASLPSPPESPPCSSVVPEICTPDQERFMKYLRRTLAATKKFRSELVHSETHESSNAYPPHAVLYGKTIPTVYAAQVAGREAIPCADAYDDLLFRPGDGVVLAREAMLPDGYSLVRSGRVSTERGHLTMLGDLPAVGQALEALIKGRRKGIGLG